MPLYAIAATDHPGALPQRLAARPEHLEYLGGKLEVTVKVAGALLNEAGDPAGSLLIVEAEDLAAAKAFADNDPFTKAGVFQSVSVSQWRVAIGAL